MSILVPESRRATLASAFVVALLVLPAARAQTIYGGEVNISGATLFRDFFAAPASTNDFIDVDGDGFAGYNPTMPPFVDQLAQPYTCYGWSGWWLVQYRGVGSGNGLAEFVDYQLLDTIPYGPPAEAGYINRLLFSDDGFPYHPCPCDPGEWDPACCDAGTPYCPSSIDLAVLDVPTRWFTRAGDVSQALWNLPPGAAGYGWSPILSWDTGFSSKLKSLERETPSGEIVALNTNTDAPDADTVFDTAIAWVPIAIVANRGTGLQDVSVSTLQYLFVTGRMPSGENLVAATRDAGSGTRNGAMNSIGVDPSWGRGENLGSKNDITARANLGPDHQPTNCGGSSVIEGVIQNRRLAVGYTGLAGGSRAAGDTLAGRYEILNIIFDDRGGSLPVRPTIDAVLDTCDPDYGFQIGGPETFTSRGDPLEYDSGAVTYMENQAAADYLRNILGSIVAFEEQPGAPDTAFMPARYLANTFFLQGGIDCLPDLADPTVFLPNEDLNQTLQNFLRANNDLGIGQPLPAFGSTSVANKVPTRTGNPVWPAGSEYENGRYSDGSTNGNYADFAGNFTVTGGVNLSQRNRLMGDFNNDQTRDLLDIPALMAAVYDARQFVQDEGIVAGSPGALGQNYVIPEIIGDFNGDGNFDQRDVRYFADGLAIDPATQTLDRDQGFTRVDEAWAVLTGNGNYFGTTLATGASYQAGAARADVAGAAPYPGAQPSGHDGIVNCADVTYVWQSFGDWNDPHQAVYMDLSCDMNGDLVVDWADILVIVKDILDAPDGDANLDGVVNAADVAIVTANLGQPGCWCDGDFNGDGIVDHCDLAVAQGQPVLAGDANCDGLVNSFDIDPFVLALTNPAAWEAAYSCNYFCANDVNRDGAVNSFDIDPFVQVLTGGGR